MSESCGNEIFKVKSNKYINLWEKSWFLWRVKTFQLKKDPFKLEIISLSGAFGLILIYLKQNKLKLILFNKM